MIEFFKLCSDEWGAIRRAPRSFILIFLTIIGIVCIATEQLHSFEMGRKDATIQELQATIQRQRNELYAYEANAPPAMPQPAVTRITALNGQIDSLNAQVAQLQRQLAVAVAGNKVGELDILRKQVTDLVGQNTRLRVEAKTHDGPRHLTIGQERDIEGAIHKLAMPLPQFFVASVADPEAAQYAREFISAFDQAGLTLRNAKVDAALSPIEVKDDTPTEHGILIAVRDPGHPPQAARVVMDVLLQAGLSPQYTNAYYEGGGEPISDDLAFVVSFR